MTDYLKNSAEKIPQLDLFSFDVWLTLIKSNPGFKPSRNSMMRQKLNLTGVNDTEFNRMLRFTDKGADFVSDTTGYQVGFEQRVIQTAHCFGRAIVSNEVLSGIRAAQKEILHEHPPLLVDGRIPESLDAIRQSGKKVALVSNTGFIDGEDMRSVFADLGIQDNFDYEIFSNEAGVAKPNPAIFDALIQASGVDPGNIMHMGDNPIADVDGARAVGMRAVLVNTGEITVVEAINDLL